MKIIKINIKRALLLTGLCVALTGCKDDVLDVKNTNELTIDLVGTDLVTTQWAVNGMYSPMQSTGMYARWLHLLLDNRSDEGQTGGSGQVNIDGISSFTLDGSNEPITMVYQACYQGINRCNTLLDREGKMTISEERANAFLGEAYFLRAHYYFNLVNLFNDVPMPLTVSNTALPKSSSREIFDQIISDLENAAKLLPARTLQENGRPSNESAFAYLGKALLFRGDLFDKADDYTAASDALKEVVSYSLVPNYTDNFNESGEYNDESLFEIGFVEDAASDTATWQGFGEFDNNTTTAGAGVAEATFRSQEYSGWAGSVPYQKLKDDYEATDPRLDDLLFSNGDSFGTGAFTWGNRPKEGFDTNFTVEFGVEVVRKYSLYIEKDKHATRIDGINRRILRYADVLLLRAEALVKSGGSVADAIGFVNEVRARTSVDMPPISASSSDAALDLIYKERRLELAYEGHRAFDLIRWGLDEANITPLQPNYNVTKRYLPLPNVAFQTNPNLK